MSGDTQNPAIIVQSNPMMTYIGDGLHVAINGWFAGDTTSGTGQYTNHILRHLPLTGASLRMTLLAPRHVQVGADLPPGVTVMHLALPPLPENLAKLWFEQVAVPRAVKHIGAGVLWTPYWAAPWWQPEPTVVTIHDLIPLLLPVYRGGLLQRGYMWLVGRTARKAAAVIAVSQATAADIAAHLRIPPARIHVIHHGPNQEGDAPPTATKMADVRARYNLPDRFFLYLGGFDARKNVPLLLAAYRRYLDQGGDPAIKLVLAGRLPTVDSAFFPDPQKIAAELQLGEQVHFCGYVAEADKPALDALAVAFFFPSLYEGFGMMLLEAMQAGAPVVTSEGVRG